MKKGKLVFAEILKKNNITISIIIDPVYEFGGKFKYNFDTKEYMFFCSEYNDDTSKKIQNIVLNREQICLSI